MSNRLSFILALILLFFVVLIPSIHVPMQADDFAYYGLGLSIGEQLNHYLSWSGRIVTNIISAYLLNLLPHFAYEVVNTVVFCLLMFFVSIAPNALGRHTVKVSSLSLLVIFALYWIANPALGETSFWIVGSANYLWTSMFVAGYFVYIFRTLDYHVGLKESFAAVIMGFLAGCSNENTSVVVVLITIFVVITERNKRVALLGLTGCVVGCAVLLLSPGNKLRSDVFVEWKSLSFLEKFFLHFYERLPSMMSSYWQVYLVIVLTLFIVLFIGKYDRKQITYAAVFFIGAVLANLAFVASPYLPTRAGNGALVLLLISLSFSISGLSGFLYRPSVKLYFISVCSFLLVYFIPSYFFFNNAVSSLWVQSKIRESMIVQAKSVGVDHIEIPSFYVRKLLKPSDGFVSGEHVAINKYYGVENIVFSSVGFDYAHIDKLPRLSVDLKIFDNVSLNNIYVYDEGVVGNSMFVFDVSGNLNGLLEAGGAIYVHVFMKGGKGVYLNRDTVTPTVSINGSAYTTTGLGVDFRNIERIDIGVYNSTKILSSFVIEYPEFIHQ
ncbi:MAG: hypothetical protein CMK72_04630 [Pseudomonadaceae bacterium]|nr:hypothetical protein [Pseudomonadaceae bacterium]HCP53924.1 hypothetical protein [Pseudomonas sp.]